MRLVSGRKQHIDSARTLVRHVGAAASHPVARNALALYAAQGARYLIPLALVPFLARILQPEAFGRLAFAQSLASLLAVVVDFGFVFSATREIARQRDHPATQNTIAAGVLGAKLLLAGFVGVACAITLAVAPGLRSLDAFLWGACFLAAAQAFSPAWFFQGVERMERQTAIEVLGSAVGAGVIFAFVREPGQAPWVLFFMGAAALGAALVNHLRMYRSIRFERPRLRAAMVMLRQSLALFFFRASIALYTGANAFLLGLLVPASVVADFAGADKLVRAGQSMFSPLGQALFPRMSHLMAHDRARGLRLAKWLLGGFAALGGTAAAVLAWLAPWAIRVFLGPGYESAVPLLRWLVFLLPLVAVSNVLGIQIMLPLGMDRATNAVIGSAAAVNIVMLLVLVPHYGALGMVWSVVTSETVVTGAMALCLLSHRAAARKRAGGVGA